jgi:hypothetical protein
MVHFMEYVQFHVHFMEGLRIHKNGRSSIFISFKFSFMKPACSQFISDPYPRYNVGFNGVKGLEFLVRQKVEKRRVASGGEWSGTLAGVAA